MSSETNREDVAAWEDRMATIEEENERLRADHAGAAEVVAEPQSGFSRRSMLRNLGGAAAVGAGAAVVGGIALPNMATAVDPTGPVSFLSKPIRLYDTRPEATTTPPGTKGKLASGSAAPVQVTAVIVDGISVPVNSKAVMGTLTVAQTDGIAGVGGYLTVYAAGLVGPAVPLSSNINWFGPGQNLATLIFTQLSATGAMAIHNGVTGPTSSAPTHVIFDAIGYVA